MISLIKNYIINKKKGIPFNILIINWIFQKILRVDANCPFSKNYTSRVLCPEKIVVENDSLSTLRSFALSGGCYIQACQGVFIGENTTFAHGVTIVSMEHDLKNVVKIGKKGKVTIGQNCWIGAKATILTGVDLGDNVVVGSNSVVTKSFKQGNVVIAGVPAKIIKQL